MTTEARNVHERKLRVMQRCGEIEPDKVHPAHKFPYISIQTLSNHLRRFMAEEGLDYTASFPGDDSVHISLINATNPEDRIDTIWPVVAGDKGYAFTIKFPLMRLFLVGDGEEADEAEMATNSGRVQRAQPPYAPKPAARPAAPRAPADGRTPTVGDDCPKCLELMDSDSTVWAGRYKLATGGPFKGQLQCTGRDGSGEWFNHHPPVSGAEQLAAATTAEIPF